MDPGSPFYPSWNKDALLRIMFNVMRGLEVVNLCNMTEENLEKDIRA